MKISTNTISILKNFAGINEGIYIKEGNTIETISRLKNVLAKAELPESFTKEFGIYDLNNFLATLSLSKDSNIEIEFEDKNIIIKGLSGRSKTKYRMAAKETILTPPDKKVNMDTAEIKFNISAEDFEWINRVASTLGSPNVAFVSDGEKICIESFDMKDDSSHVNSTEIGNSDGKKFKMIFATENLKMVPGAYQVSISSRGIGHFKNSSISVEYWITTETGSKYEG